jgi:hypothetical protein
MSPRALDLYCGKGGWTDGLMAAGFDVVGLDLFPQPDYKGQFVQANILLLEWFPEVGFILILQGIPFRHLGFFDFICASSPCEEFSVHGMKHFHPNPKYPEMGLQLFNHTRALCEKSGIPYVMENVRPAQKFVGAAVTHCGPFYLWGNGLPAIMSFDAYQVKKNIQHAAGFSMSMTAAEKKACRKNDIMLRSGSKSKVRKEHTAAAAMIPLPISWAVAQNAWSLYQLRSEAA